MKTIKNNLNNEPHRLADHMDHPCTSQLLLDVVGNARCSIGGHWLGGAGLCRLVQGNDTRLRYLYGLMFGEALIGDYGSS